MKTSYLSACALLTISFSPSSALSDTFYYQATVDTSSLAGVAGNLDFAFTPGLPSPPPAMAFVSDFAGGTPTGTPSTYGPVSGALPGELTIANSASSDYYQPFIYGNSLTFEVGITETLTSAAGGNLFAFSMFDNAASPNPVLTMDSVNGFAFTIAFPSDDLPSATNYSPETTLAFFTPEPATAALFLLGFACAMGVRRKCFKYKN